MSILSRIEMPWTRDSYYDTIVLIMPKHYATTNIRLPANLLQEVKLRAVRERKSAAELIRECLIEKFHYRRTSPPLLADHNPALDIIGIGASGVRDGSIHHDHYLYGPSRRRTRR